jgi:hypothetical protein
MYVNVGMANRNAPWMDVPADSTTTKQVLQNWTNSRNPHNCRTKTVSFISDGIHRTRIRKVCDYDKETVYESRPVTTSEVWRGCAGSREYPWNVRDGNVSYSIPGVTNASCPNEITPLTSNKARLASEIARLNTSGNTYLPAGLIWGWRTLSAELPYAEGVTDAVAAQNNISKHLILMTD